jgi:hypothetical protein
MKRKAVSSSNRASSAATRQVVHIGIKNYLRFE